MFSYVPLPGAIAAKLTMEKESKMKLLLLVLGMSPHAFWYVSLLASYTYVYAYILYSFIYNYTD